MADGPHPRHCERSEAIHAATKLLAMTRRQRRLLTLSLRPRRSPTAARGGVSSLPVIASRAKQSISPHERKDGLLRRFRLRSLSFGGQVAPRNDGKCSFAFRHGRAQPSEGRRRFRSPMSRPSTSFFLIGCLLVGGRHGAGAAAYPMSCSTHSLPVICEV